MFEWITGPRITNAIEDIQPDHGYETTFIEAPETPAHQFAVKAFKRAVFGTPAPEDANNAAKKLQKKTSPDLAHSKVPAILAPKEDAPPLSPSKQPGGILMTPGTANRGRKSVTFGAHVVDNEGKRENVSRSGIPNDCPGKFPSPWTPGTELKSAIGSEQKPRTKLTAAFMDARTTTQPRAGLAPKARDDSDITIDLGAPRSNSGKYWKEQYDSYRERSEKEMKKIISKQQLAKNYAQKKDGEVTELVTKLEQERKRYRRREQELETQSKEFQERLRQAMADQLSASIEVTALKSRIATLEKSMASSSSDSQNTKSSSPFEIFEDYGRNAEASQSEQRAIDASHLSQKVRVVSVGKENSPPKPRHLRRQSMPEQASPARISLGTTPQLGVATGQSSTILGRSLRIPDGETEIISHSRIVSPPRVQDHKPVLSVRKADRSHQKMEPKSPLQALPSSPLPQPSPDPWMDANESLFGQMDKMALPIGGGGGGGSRKNTRPTRPTHAGRQGAAKPATLRSRADRPSEETKAKGPTRAGSSQDSALDGNASITRGVASSAMIMDVAKTSGQTTDTRFDVSKIASHHAEDTTQVKQERVVLPVDRKAEARRRLEARKQKKLLGK